IDLAVKCNAELVVLHVEIHHATAQEIEHILEGSEISPEIRQEIGKLRKISAPIPVGGGRRPSALSPLLAKHVADSIFGQAMTKAKKAGLQNISTRLVSGSPAKQIIKAAQEEKAKLIVMG